MEMYIRSIVSCIYKLGATLKEDSTDNKPTDKMPTLRKIKRAVSPTISLHKTAHFILPNLTHTYI
ncbi:MULTISPECIES: hypothetical protein [Flavobacterium]|uniref:hypothetical protein n=1 Tax=Flavobacterium TaxID=237 RepID=UPI000F4F6FD6|nr:MULTISPECIES: hypothetical protein [Flavobacterium]